MTVSSESNKIIYDANGATTIWAFTFSVQDDDEVYVTLTNADGTVTLLPTTSYLVTINPTTGTNPTAVGGTVTYPLSGSPLALGNTLTLQRLVPFTQPTSLANQGITWQATIELALDYLTFQTQQLSSEIGQQFSVPVSDPPPEVLPVASLRANMLAGFDADGNMIAVALTDAGQVMVSTAMIPVVEAATLALARTAMGLGTMATEGIGAGLQDDGAGLVRTVMTPVADSTNKAVIASFHETDRHATGALTYTCPAASTLFAGFGFFVTAETDTITFALAVSDSFLGMATGVSFLIPAGATVYISTDGATGWFAKNVQGIGYSSALNVQLSASVASNALTIALKDRNGLDPSPTSPVLTQFRDPTITSGAPVNRAVTSALSVVVPNGAELGTADAVPFRVWVLLFDNAGTPVLGVIQTVTGGAAPSAIAAIDEAIPSTGTAIGTGSDSAAVIYTASGVTSKSFRILGYIDFNSGQVSKGVWAAAPSRVQLFGPGVKKPGDVVQTIFKADSTYGGSLGTTALPIDNTIPQIGEGNAYAGLSTTIVPQSAVNILGIDALIYCCAGVLTNIAVAMFRDATAGAVAASVSSGPEANQLTLNRIATMINATSAVSTTFSFRVGNTAGQNMYVNGTSAAALMNGTMKSSCKIQEIMC